MTWSDVCSTYAVLEKSLEKKAPNHASVNKFCITWQAFSILRVLQPIFFSEQYSSQLNKVCAILHGYKSLTINRFQYIQVLADECSTAMLKQLPDAFKDSETHSALDGKNTKRAFPNKGQIRQVFSSELLRFLLQAYTTSQPDESDLKRIKDTIDNQKEPPTIIKNIWKHLESEEHPDWIKVIDKALFFYIEYLVDFCRVNSFRNVGMRFIDTLAKKLPLSDNVLKFDDKTPIHNPAHLPESTCAKHKYKTLERYEYAMKTGLFESTKHAKTVGNPAIGNSDSKKRLMSVPISFQACLKQITYQALYSEKNPSSPTNTAEWWNMFNIGLFVRNFELKASRAITTRHKELESQQPKAKQANLEITVGLPRKRLLEELMTSFITNKNKRHKTEIFQRTLTMVSRTCSAEHKSDNISEAEVTLYNDIFKEPSSKPTNDKEVAGSGSSGSSDDDGSASDRSSFGQK